jgi:transposase
MLNDLDNLPNDTAELHGLVGQMANEIKSQALLIEKLRHQVAGQNIHRFGSKAEGLDQLQLRLEDEEVADAAAAPAGPTEHAVECVKAKPKRKPLPEHLPRVEQVLSAGKACTDCGGTLRELGRDATEELEYVPGRFVVNLTIRPRMACKGCEAISPSHPIEKGIAGPGFVAHVLVANTRTTCPSTAKRKYLPVMV